MTPYLGPIREAWKHKGFRWQVVATIVFLAPMLIAFSRFLDFVERRAGVTFADPVLILFQPVDLTWLTFLVIYVGLIAAIIILLRHPQHLLLALQAYTVMIVVRTVAMYLIPLDPPPGLIELKDPFVEFFGTGWTPTRDLFFSGHTATLFLLALSIPVRPLKILYLLFATIVAVCVILQHVHYTIDVFAALFFAYGCYHMIYAIRRPFLKHAEPADRP